ncbi:MAG: Gfo/Idh/MocA family protein [Candidatus Sumerlaeaceae bacterium]
MPKLAVGVIGTGSIGNVHLTGYAAEGKSVEIQAICDIRRERLDEMGEKFKVPAQHRYRDYRKMLASEQLDVTSICLPNSLHFDAAAESIRHGLHTLIEKPMVLTMEQARALKKLHAKHPVKVMVSFSHRFMPQNIRAKKLIEQGKLGKPFMIRVRYAHGGPYPGWAQTDWFYKKKMAGGGALLDMGIHAIDMCQYMIGPIKSISAQLKTLRKKIEVDDNAVMLLDFGPENKALGYIECGWTSGPGFAGVEIYGDKGTLILDIFKPGRWIRGVNRPDGAVETLDEQITTGQEKTHWPLEMESWVKHLLGKKTPTYIPGLEEGASSLAVALAAIESSKTGKRVHVRG